MGTDQSSTIEAVPLGSLSGADWLRLMSGFFWRGLVWTVLCMILGGVAGAAIGAIVGAAVGGGPTYTRIAMPMAAVAGLAIGFLSLRGYLAWILAARYGPLRLLVVRGRPVETQADRAA